MPKFIANEEKFEPIEIEHKGVTYVVKPLTTELLMKSTEIELRMASGEIDAIDEDLLLYLNIPKKVLKIMTYREKNGILNFIGKATQNPEAYMGEAQKKSIASGVSSVRRLP